jgi:hypothetical protein
MQKRTERTTTNRDIICSSAQWVLATSNKTSKKSVTTQLPPSRKKRLRDMYPGYLSSSLTFMTSPINLLVAQSRKPEALANNMRFDFERVL